jgi:REP element-mobilizing transposase RayT
MRPWLALQNPGEVVFGTFDPKAEIDRSQRCLPHWFQSGVAVFVTFRTADSMPRHVIERWQREQENWLLQQGLLPTTAIESEQIAKLPSAVRAELRRLRDRSWHRSLDDCHGSCELRRPELARIVGEALLHFNGDRYDLDSFVVMPNHVHVLVQFRPLTSLADQTESWLRYTARKINKRLGRQGAFWQSEPFDHLVRSDDQFEYLQRYIAENPQKANLRVGEYLYWNAPRLPES